MSSPGGLGALGAAAAAAAAAGGDGSSHPLSQSLGSTGSSGPGAGAAATSGGAADGAGIGRSGSTGNLSSKVVTYRLQVTDPEGRTYSRSVRFDDWGETATLKDLRAQLGAFEDQAISLLPPEGAPPKTKPVKLSRDSKLQSLTDGAHVQLATSKLYQRAAPARAAKAARRLEKQQAALKRVGSASSSGALGAAGGAITAAVAGSCFVKVKSYSMSIQTRLATTITAGAAARKLALRFPDNAQHFVLFLDCDTHFELLNADDTLSNIDGMVDGAKLRFVKNSWGGSDGKPVVRPARRPSSSSSSSSHLRAGSSSAASSSSSSSGAGAGAGSDQRSPRSRERHAKRGSSGSSGSSSSSSSHNNNSSSGSGSGSGGSSSSGGGGGRARRSGSSAGAPSTGGATTAAAASSSSPSGRRGAGAISASAAAAGQPAATNTTASASPEDKAAEEAQLAELFAKILGTCKALLLSGKQLKQHVDEQVGEAACFQDAQEVAQNAVAVVRAADDAYFYNAVLGDVARTVRSRTLELVRSTRAVLSNPMDLDAKEGVDTSSSELVKALKELIAVAETLKKDGDQLQLEPAQATKMTDTMVTNTLEVFEQLRAMSTASFNQNEDLFVATTRKIVAAMNELFGLDLELGLEMHANMKGKTQRFVSAAKTSLTQTDLSVREGFTTSKREMQEMLRTFVLRATRRNEVFGAALKDGKFGALFRDTSKQDENAGQPQFANAEDAEEYRRLREQATTILDVLQKRFDRFQAQWSEQDTEQMEEATEALVDVLYGEAGRPKLTAVASSTGGGAGDGNSEAGTGAAGGSGGASDDAEAKAMRELQQIIAMTSTEDWEEASHKIKRAMTKMEARARAAAVTRPGRRAAAGGGGPGANPTGGRAVGAMTLRGGGAGAGAGGAGGAGAAADAASVLQRLGITYGDSVIEFLHAVNDIAVLTEKSSAAVRRAIAAGDEGAVTERVERADPGELEEATRGLWGGFEQMLDALALWLRGPPRNYPVARSPARRQPYWAIKIIAPAAPVFDINEDEDDRMAALVSTAAKKRDYVSAKIPFMPNNTVEEMLGRICVRLPQLEPNVDWALFAPTAGTAGGGDWLRPGATLGEYPDLKNPRAVLHLREKDDSRTEQRHAMMHLLVDVEKVMAAENVDRGEVLSRFSRALDAFAEDESAAGNYQSLKLGLEASLQQMVRDASAGMHVLGKQSVSAVSVLAQQRPGERDCGVFMQVLATLKRSVPQMKTLLDHLETYEFVCTAQNERSNIFETEIGDDIASSIAAPTSTAAAAAAAAAAGPGGGSAILSAAAAAAAAGNGVYATDPKRMEPILGEEGDLTGGTLNQIVLHATSADIVDSEFLQCFVTTYQSFTTSYVLLQKVLQRYDVPADVPADAAARVRLRVGVFVKVWIEKHAVDLDEQIMDGIAAFLEKLSADGQGALAERLQVEIDKQRAFRQSMVKKQEQLHLEQLRPETGDEGDSAPNQLFMQLNESEIARQLTMIEFAIFRDLRPTELLNQAWTKPRLQHKAPHVLTLIGRSNQLSFWVATFVLVYYRRSDRVKALQKLIAIGTHLRQLHNYNSLMGLLMGLAMSPVERLKHTWSALPAASREELQELRAVMSPTSSYKTLRAEMAEARGQAMLPYLGIFLSDLTFTEDGNPDHVDDDPMMVNMTKRRLIHKLVQSVEVYQAVPHKFPVVEPIHSFMTQLSFLDEDELYEISLLREPRGCAERDIVP